MLRSKSKTVKINVKIPKRLVLQLTLFLGVIAVATVLDIYFDKNSVEIETAENETQKTADEPGKVYLFSQSNASVAKTPVQKNQNRKFCEKHTKFLQRYHESTNFRKLKSEVKKPKTHLFPAYHYLLFRNYYVTVPDDDPHLS